jgi:streptomycin 6-kinase
MTCNHIGIKKFTGDFANWMSQLNFPSQRFESTPPTKVVQDPTFDVANSFVNHTPSVGLGPQRKAA